MPTAAQSSAARERALAAWRMRKVERMTYAAIGAAFNVSYARARQLAMKGQRHVKSLAFAEIGGWYRR